MSGVFALSGHLLLNDAAFAADEADEEPPAWSFLRGPGYDGHSSETGLVAGWPESGPPVLWTMPIGQGYSGFVAKGDRVYSQRQSLTGQTVLCLNADDGRVVWEYRYDGPYDPAGLYPGPRATPTLARSKVYFSSPDVLIGCLSEDGKLLWQVDAAERFKIKEPGFGYAISPVIVDDLVLLPIGGPGASVVALHADTGATVWQAGDDPASYTPVLPIRFENRLLAIGYLENSIVAHDLKTGQLVWRDPLSEGYDEHAAWPIYREPYLWHSAPFQVGSRLLKLGADEPGFTKVWGQRRMMANDVASSVLVGEHLYGFDLKDPQAKVHRPSRGVFRCIEFLTGKTRWETAEVGHASVLVAEGKLILLNDTGTLMLARATPERYEELARCDVLSGEIGWTPPALYRKRLYVRNHSRAVCVYLGSPEELRSEASMPREYITVEDLPQQRYRDLSGLLGVEPEYAMDVPSRTWLSHWLVTGLSMLASSMLLALSVRKFRKWRRYEDAVFRVLAFTMGCAGTTMLSPWRGEFTFTWMLPVFAVLDLVVTPMATETNSQRLRGWRHRTGDLTFLLTCFAYYWLCKRLSLVTQWSFLIGQLPAAIVLFTGFRLARNQRWEWLWKQTARLLAFVVMYATGVAIIAQRYEIPD